jgi:predicted nucleic acid-binding protein
MASKIFLDANILLDLTLKRGGYDEAKAILDVVIGGRVQAFTTSSVIHIAGYYLTKAYGSKKAKDLLLGILMDVTIIDLSHEMAIVALSSNLDDIEDSLQYFAAIHHKIDYFISQDKQLKKDSIPILPVLTPGEFIAAFEKIS